MDVWRCKIWNFGNLLQQISASVSSSEFTFTGHYNYYFSFCTRTSRAVQTPFFCTSHYRPWTVVSDFSDYTSRKIVFFLLNSSGASMSNFLARHQAYDMLSGSQINGLGLVMPSRSLMAHPLEMSMLHAQVTFHISLRSCLHIYSSYIVQET